MTNRITIAASAMMPTTTAARTPPDTPFLSGVRTVSACSYSRRAVGVSTTTRLCSTSRSAMFVLLENQLMNVCETHDRLSKSYSQRENPTDLQKIIKEEPL